MSTSNLNINFPEYSIYVTEIDKHGNQNTYPICEICGKRINGRWCIRQCCEECCLSGYCLMAKHCTIFPQLQKRREREQKTRTENEVIENPTKRVKR